MAIATSTALLAAGALGAGATAYAANKSKVNAPAPIDPYEVGTKSLQAQLDLAPSIFAANQQYAPQYAQLSNALLQQQVLGTPNFDAAGALANDPWAVANRAQINAEAARTGRTPEQWLMDHLRENPGDPALQAIAQRYTTNTGGLLDTYRTATPQLAAIQAQANTAQRSADIADVAKLGLQATAAYRAANPELTAALGNLTANVNAAANAPAPQVGLFSANTAAASPSLASIGNLAPASLANAANASLTTAQGRNATGGPLLGQMTADASRSLNTVSPIQQQLNAQAQELLAQGGNLSAQDLRNIEQSTRGAYASRGLYDSNQAIGAEILNTDAARRARLFENQRQAGAIDAAGQSQIQANRGYAQGVQAQGQNLSQFNTGQQNQIGLFNAGAANDISRFNAQNQTNVSLANAAAQNQFGLAQYNTQADIARINAGLGTQTSLANAAAQNDASRYNAGLSYQTGLANAGLQMQQQQQGTQGLFGLAGLLGQQAQDPYQMVLGRSGAPSQAMGAVGQAGSINTGMQNFDPFNASIMNMYAGNQANQLAANTATANNQAGLYGSFLGALGNFGGAAMGACWVARAVYGAQDGRWLLFRRWLLQRAPEGLAAWYLIHGPTAAKLVGRDAKLRAQVRRFMDRCIEEISLDLQPALAA